jgi:mannose/fructose/N-acetylgalactosamine-specific phosphotransferase system component IID
VKPWGFWKPIHELVIMEEPNFKENKDFKLDMFNVIIGVIAQLCLTILPMYLITGMFESLWITIGILAIIILVLKRTWWNRLED